MRLLLDTHVFLGAVAGSAALRPASRRIIESADQVFVSAALTPIPSPGCWSPSR